MDEESVEQRVEISDQAQARDITLIGKLIQEVKQPSKWQEATWRYVSENPAFLAIALVLEASLAVVYFSYANRYLIPLWSWVLAAILLFIVMQAGYSWYRSERTKTKLALALSAAVFLAAILIWQAWSIAFPRPFQPGVFGIAVAELGEGASHRRTDQARSLSSQVYERLCLEITGLFSVDDCEDRRGTTGESTGTSQVKLRRIGVMPDSRTAVARAERIGANVVIWGEVLTSKEGGVNIYFRLLETQDRAVSPEVPLVLPVTFSSADMYSAEIDLKSDEEVKQVIAQQSAIIASSAFGLEAYYNQDYPEAVKQFQSVVDDIEEAPRGISDKGRSLFYFYLGRANHGLGRIQEGQSALQKAGDLDQKGEEPAVLMGLALGHGSLGENQEKEEDLRLALLRTNRWLATHPEDDAARYDRGIIYEMLGQRHYAVLDFQKVIEHDPDYFVAYISLGLNYSSLGDFVRAEQVLSDAIAVAEKGGANPAWAHLNLALVYEKSDSFESARAQYEKAVALSPRSSWMHYSHGRFLEGQQEMEAALPAYQKMAETARDPGWAYGKLADFLRREGLLVQARESYEVAVHARPEDPLLHAHLAETCFELSQTEADREKRRRLIAQAHEEFQTATDQAGNLYYLYSSYGNVLFQLGEYQRAAEAYERSLELRASDWGVLLNLGRTYENLDQSERAKEQYLRILDLRDDFPGVALQIACERLEALGVESPCE